MAGIPEYDEKIKIKTKICKKHKIKMEELQKQVAAAKDETGPSKGDTAKKIAELTARFDADRDGMQAAWDKREQDMTTTVQTALAEQEGKHLKIARKHITGLEEKHATEKKGILKAVTGRHFEAMKKLQEAGEAEKAKALADLYAKAQSAIGTQKNQATKI